MFDIIINHDSHQNLLKGCSFDTMFPGDFCLIGIRVSNSCHAKAAILAASSQKHSNTTYVKFNYAFQQL